MVAFPNCKINLGLSVTGKRPDGFHDLETVFYPLPLHDVLEVIHEAGNHDAGFHLSGLSIQGDPDSNLCVKAFELLKRDHSFPAPQLHLHKQIPMGAGLGGGSSDGAFTLQLLNRKFNLNISPGRLAAYALELGSDCPFFLLNTPSYATGRGEILEPVEVDLHGYHWLLVNPGIHISTPEAFSMIVPATPATDLREIIMQGPRAWRGLLVNQFEAPAIERHPEIGELIEALYQHGAVYAAMTGTGSTVYGLFPDTMKPKPAFPDHWFSQWVG